MKIFPKILLAFLLLSPLALCARTASDTLFMKDKTIRIGKITSRDSIYTRIKAGQDNLVILNDDITRIGWAAQENLLLPDFGIQLSGGMAFPEQFSFPNDIGMRACVRYMFGKSFGAYASLNYMMWQNNFDTVKRDPNNIKSTTTFTETYTLVALSPRIGVFIVEPLSKTVQLLFGLDFGQTFFSISDMDSSVSPGSTFSYSLRADFRFGIGDNLALLLGGQYESFYTNYSYLEQYSFQTGPARRIGDVLLSGGIEYGF